MYLLHDVSFHRPRMPWLASLRERERERECVCVQKAVALRLSSGAVFSLSRRNGADGALRLRSSD